MVGEDSISARRIVGAERNVPTSLALGYWRMKITLERELGVGLGAWFLLNRLRAEEGISQGELCRRNDLDPSRITRLAQRLERDGLIRRERDPDDNRVVRMYLTEDGREFIEERDGRYGAFTKAMEDALGEDGTEEFERSLKALDQTLKQYGRKN